MSFIEKTTAEKIAEKRESLNSWAEYVEGEVAAYEGKLAQMTGAMLALECAFAKLPLTTKNSNKAKMIAALLDWHRESFNATRESVQAELDNLLILQQEEQDMIDRLEAEMADAQALTSDEKYTGKVEHVTHLQSRPLNNLYIVKYRNDGLFDLQVEGQLVAEGLESVAKARRAAGKHASRELPQGFKLERESDGRWHAYELIQTELRGDVWMHMRSDGKEVSHAKRSQAELYLSKERERRAHARNKNEGAVVQEGGRTIKYSCGHVWTLKVSASVARELRKVQCENCAKGVTQPIA